MTPILGIMASQISGNLTSPSSYESIATLSGTGSSATISFTSIPSTYKHLQIRWIAQSAGAPGSLQVRFNGDSASNYTYHELTGNGSTAAAAAATPLGFIYAGQYYGTANMFGSGVIDILDYQNINKNKTLRTLNGRDENGSGIVLLQSGSWMNSSTAISSITLTGNGGNIATNSSFALYGVKG
jgi:hypothetical protein